MGAVTCTSAPAMMALFASVRDAATPLTSASVGRPHTMKCSKGEVIPASPVTSPEAARLCCASLCCRIHSLFSFVNASGLNHDAGLGAARLGATLPLVSPGRSPPSPELHRAPGPSLDRVPTFSASATSPAIQPAIES